MYREMSHSFSHIIEPIKTSRGEMGKIPRRLVEFTRIDTFAMLFIGNLNGRVSTVMYGAETLIHQSK